MLENVWCYIPLFFFRFGFKIFYFKVNKTGLQTVSRPVELVHYFGGWVEVANKQTDRTDDGWVQSTFGAKAEQLIYLHSIHKSEHWSMDPYVKAWDLYSNGEA